jgi:hypothetical protein
VYKDDDSKSLRVPNVDNIVGIEEYDPEGYDGYITAQVLLPKVDKFNVGMVVRRCLEEDGNLNR